MRRIVAILALMAGIASGVSVSAWAQTAVTAFPPGWAPVGTGVSLSVSNSSSNVQLGWVGVRSQPPPNVLVCNTGGATAYINLGTAAVTATTSNLILPSNSGGTPPCALLSLNGATNIAAITGASTTTLISYAGSGSPQGALLNGGGVAGITQLTGDVTAGPGSGSQAATVAAIDGNAVSLAGPLSSTGAATIVLAFPASSTETYTFPAASATLATLGANTFTGSQSMVGLNSSASVSSPSSTTNYFALGSTAGSGSTYELLLDGNQSVANTGTYGGLEVEPGYTAASGTLSSEAGIASTPQLAGGGTITTMYGVISSPTVISAATGAVGTAYGVWSKLINSASGYTIGTGYDFYAAAPTLTGAITTRWGFYEADTAANYFAGGLTVAGTLNLTGISNAAGNEILCYNTSAGPVTYENAVGGCVPSDASLKNITRRLNPFVAMWRVAWYLPVYYYTFKPDSGLGTENYVGLLAQDVCAMDTTLCRWDAKGTLNYDKIGLAAYVISALKGAAYSIFGLIVLAFGGLVGHTRRQHRKLHERMSALGDLGV